jgi:hypothetical protein
MPRAAKDTTVGREEVRRRLGGLAVYELEDAVAAGLLTRLGNRRFTNESVAMAEEDLEHWREWLHEERRLNATEAAARLGVPVARFRRAVQAHQIKSVRSEPWKYGTIHYYRGADIDALAGWLIIDVASRHVESVVARPVAAQKAAETRRRNRERALAARVVADAAAPGEHASSVEVVVYAAALAVEFKQEPGDFSRFVNLAVVRQLAGLLSTARYTPGEQQTLLAEWYARARSAQEDLVKAHEIEDTLGAPHGALARRLPHAAGLVSRSDVRLLLLLEPGYIEEEQTIARERSLLEEVSRIAAGEERRAAAAHAAVMAEALLAAYAPGEDAHPSVVVRFGVALLMTLRAHDSVLKDLLCAAGVGAQGRNDSEIIDGLRRTVSDQLSPQRQQEIIAEWRGRLAKVRPQLSCFAPSIKQAVRTQRLSLLAPLGLVHFGNLVVAGEVSRILAAHSTLADSWIVEDLGAAAKRRRDADKKAARRKVRKEKAVARQESWRRSWARQIGVPIEQIPLKIGNPTSDAVRAVKRQPPTWAKRPETPDQSLGA